MSKQARCRPWVGAFVLAVVCGTVRVSAGAHSDAVDAAERFMNNGRFSDALEAFRAALQLDGSDVYSMQGAATALSEMGRFVEAGQYFERAALSRRMPQFFMNAGMTYERGLDIDKAIGAYSSCVAMAPGFRPCHVKIAGAYNEVGRFVEVQQHLQVAISLDPTDFTAYSYLGDTYNNLKQFSLAIDTYKAGIPYAGGLLGQLLASIADTYSNRKMYADAKAFYDQAIEFYGRSQAPTDLLIGTLFNQLQMGDWAGYEEAVSRILRESTAAALSGRPSPLSPYRALFLPMAAETSALISRSWAQAFIKTAAAAHRGAAPQSLPVRDGPIECTASQEGECTGQIPSKPHPLQVAYISRRFEDYPGTQMMLRLFAEHNRSAVRVHAFAHGPDDGSQYRAFIRERSDRFEDISHLPVPEAADRIARAGLDVLVDYDGLHDFNSVKVLLRRPAAVQMTWLGFAASTGFSPGEAVDYIIADRTIAAPDVLGRHFSERVVLLPGTYQPQDEWQGAAAGGEPFAAAGLWFDRARRTAARLELLSEYGNFAGSKEALVDKFWYICFNRVEKITMAAFGDWMQILVRSAARPSVLVLMSQSQSIDAQITMNAAALGVSPHRLVFLKPMPKRQYVGALAVSDLFLDTDHYGAHTTASDGMYGTLPVLTLPKATLSSRVAAGLNAAVGLSDVLSAESRKAYVEIAAQLSCPSAAPLLTKIRIQIREALGEYIFNSTQFSSRLESAYSAARELLPAYRHLFFQSLR